MIKSIFIFIVLLLTKRVTAQPGDLRKISMELEAEGKKLYRSEMASWYGTDLFMEKAGEKKDDLRGYFSYEEKEKTVSVFFDENGAILATIRFDSTFSTEKAEYDGKSRSMTTFEKDLYALRAKALEIANNDTLFVVYKNTNLNLIPLIEKNSRRVYFLTGAAKSGVVLFGNDYLLTFDEKNELLTKKRLHSNLIPVYYEDEKESEKGKVIGAMHNHSPATGDFITVTDICTLMLYAKFAGWEQHMVISENYVSIWHCDSNQLTILSKADWEKKKKP